jgi:cytochrome P450
MSMSTATTTAEPFVPSHAPRLRYPHPMGALRYIRDEPLRFMTGITREHGDVVQFRVGPYNTMLFAHPDAVKHVLVTNSANYDKHTPGFEVLGSLLGNGLLTSQGEFWRRQRRIAQPAFHRRRIAGFAETMVAFTEQMLERWEDAAGLGRTIDLAAEMNALTLRIVAKTLLGTEMGPIAEQVAEAVTAVNVFVNKATTGLLDRYLPTRDHLRAREAVRTLDRIVLDLVAERRRRTDSPDDLLTMLMEARDEETGEGMSDRQLRDEILTMFLAGHETTSNALAWTFYLLSTHPGIARRTRTELDEVLAGRSPTVDDLPRMTYTSRVVKESMRLYPPAWTLERRAREDDMIAGHRVRAGSLILLSAWVTHRHPTFWPNPEGFDPDRFEPEAEKQRPRHAYFPFGAGPRQCIGNNFAMMESQLIVATILPRFRPWLVPGHPVVPEPLITLRPKHGLQMGLA